MTSQQRGVVPMVLAVVGVIAITLVGLCVWRFTPTREVRATTPIVCGALRLEVREVVESSGREVLHVGERFWEVGAPGETRATTGEAHIAQVPTNDWLAPGELPQRAATRTPGTDEAAWNVHAPDTARFACLSANLPTLERALALPLPGGSGVVVVWNGTVEDVWPVFRAIDGDMTLSITVRRSGSIEGEIDGGDAIVSLSLGLLHRDEAGARVLLVAYDPIDFAPLVPPASMRGDAASLLAIARDASGRTLVQRFPIASQRAADSATIRALTPNVTEAY